MTTSEALKLVRAQLGLTQEQFARRMDVTTRTVSRYETEEKPSGPFLKRLWLLAQELNLPESAAAFRRACFEAIQHEYGFTLDDLKAVLSEKFTSA